MDICPACKQPIDGKVVQYGPFKNHPVLKQLRISKMCAACISAIPPEILARVMGEPQFYVAAKKKKEHGLIDPKNHLTFAGDGNRIALPPPMPGMEIGVARGTQDPRAILSR